MSTEEIQPCEDEKNSEVEEEATLEDVGNT